MPMYLLIALVCIATAARFFSLASSPMGFYIDEAAISAQIICIKQSGSDLWGQPFPLFTQVLGGGFATAPYMYASVVWTSVFGNSIAAFRGLAAFSSALFIIGSFVLGLRFWKSRPAAWLCALAAALSPWAFQFSRIAWDPALAPALCVWAFALLWADGRWVKSQMALGGFVLALAAYSYPPLRVQLAIMTPFAFYLLFVREKRGWLKADIFIGVAAIAALPLVIKTVSGELQRRFSMLSVFNSDYLRQFGEPSFGLGLQKLIENMALNLSPTYLFVTGDSNLRHSTSEFGLWGWIDIAAFVLAASVLLVRVQRKKWQPLPWAAIAFVILGYVAGVLPAALTWESNPHALRSIGASVFLALGVGGALHVAWRIRFLRELVLVIGAAFVFFFGKTYALTYPQKSYLWFDTTVTEVAQQLAHQGRMSELSAELKRSGIDYDPMAVAYYELASGVRSCAVTKTPEAN